MQNTKNTRKRIRDMFLYSMLTLAVSALAVGAVYSALKKSPVEEIAADMENASLSEPIEPIEPIEQSKSQTNENTAVCPESTNIQDTAAKNVASQVSIPESNPPSDAVATADEPIEVPVESAASEISDDTFVKPVNNYISRPFSADLPVYSPTMYDYRTHNGIDIVGEIGQTVVSTANGTVSAVYDDYLLGKTVEITHPSGLVSCYANLQNDLPNDITVGVAVACGQTIGGIGDTAKSESLETPHVHFELKKDGAAVNPCDYIPW